MKRLITALTGLGLATALTIAMPAGATIIPVEGAVETVALEISLRDDRTGTVSGRSCAECERRSFAVTRATRAYRNSQPVDIRDALRQRGKPAAIIYDLESGQATKILW